jgi:hypothetical protein
MKNAAAMASMTRSSIAVSSPHRGIVWARRGADALKNSSDRSLYYPDTNFSARWPLRGT